MKYTRCEHPLKTEIYKKGYNITNFAQMIDVDRWTLQNIFKRKSMPRGDTICFIAKGLEMSYERVEQLCRMNK